MSFKTGIWVGCGWLIGMLLFSSCQERFFLEAPPEDFQQISINGAIDDSGGPYFVEVMRTGDTDDAPTPVESAGVFLHDDQGNREFFYSIGEGRYQCEGAVIQGTPGGSYYITVDINGDSYTSRPETMPSALGSSEMTWEETTQESTSQVGTDFETRILDFDMTAQLPQVEEPVYLLWQFIETFQIRPTDFPDPFGYVPPPCYIIQNVGVRQFELLSLEEYDGSTYSLESVIQRRIDISFLVKHIFSIRESSITESYYNYLTQVGLLIESTGSLFDPPPGRIKGNIERNGDGPDVVGYFAALVSDTTHLATYRADIETYIEDICLYSDRKEDDEYPAFCLNCSLVPNTTSEPYWWDLVK